MALRITAGVDGRFEDRLATSPAGLVSATDTVLNRWAVEPLAPVTTVRSPDACPGPLVWLEGAGALGWGPVVVRGDEPAWATAPLVAAAVADLGGGAAAEYRLVLGAVDAEGARVALVLSHRPPRVVAARARSPAGPGVRVAVVDPAGAASRVVVDGGPLPAALAWGDGPLRLGVPGRVVEHHDGGPPNVLDVGDLSAPRALAACTDGELAAGTAAGAVAVFRDGHRVGRWVAHDGPVTALAWSPGAGRLASGGADGTVRVWDPAGHPVDAARTGGPVEALAWLGDGRLAVKSGGPGGRVALYAPSSANSRQ